MKKTVFVADLMLYNPTKRHFFDHYERRVYVGEDGHGYIRMNGGYERLTYYYPTSENYGDRDRVVLSIMPY